MLRWLTKRLRFRAAIALIALYALCVVAPSVALALTDGTVAAHCLTDDHHRGTNVHIQSDGHAHSDNAAHEHSGGAGPVTGDDTEQPSHVGGCCGLFCFAAVSSDPVILAGQFVHASPIMPLLDDSLAGRGPDRLNRPPIALLSL